MKRFKTTTFREGYNPSFPEFLKSHGHVISVSDMEAAYHTLTGRSITKKQKNELNKLIDGNTSTTAGKSKEVKPSEYN